MEKLIELLKEYIENYGNDAKVREEENYILDTWIEFVYWSRVYLYETIISKKFWFIQWLVENEKIDLEKVKEKIWIPCFVWYTEWEISCVNDKEDYEQLLMLLSIQDNPIDYLCEILK